MSAQTLNVIYDTNYTNTIPNGGFVDHEFTKKLWFFDLLFGPLGSSQPSKNKGKNAPDWNSNWKKASDKTELKENIQSDKSVTQSANSTEKDGSIDNLSQNHEIAKSEDMSEDSTKKPKNKSWIDSMK